MWQASVVNRSKINGSGCPFCAGRKVLVGATDLATTHPATAVLWHTSKNSPLMPQDVVAGAARIVWWRCRDGHEWQARVSKQAGKTCPVCAGTRLVTGVNDLATMHPSLAAEWRRDLNDSSPEGVTPASTQVVAWQCAAGHVWQARVNVRVSDPTCPRCEGRPAHPARTNLAGTRARRFTKPLADHPIAGEWHPTKNQPLTPADVSVHSQIPCWWTCARGHEWTASPANRTRSRARNRGTGCPYCSNFSTLAGYNDLATTRPDIAAEWDSNANDGLTAQDVTAGSNRRVRWVCPDGHRWQAAVVDRTRGGRCPYCTGKRPVLGVTDLATTHPQIAALWDDDANAPATPTDVRATSSRAVHWRGPCGHQWRRTITAQVRNPTCPDCRRTAPHEAPHHAPRAPRLSQSHPDIADMWHPTANGDLTPDRTHARSHQIVTWQAACGHQWTAGIDVTVRRPGCAVCQGRRLQAGVNDLATTHPHLAAQWDTTRNNGLTPQDVMASSTTSVHWVCEHGHRWKGLISNRASGAGCRTCTALDEGRKSLAALEPELAT